MATLCRSFCLVKPRLKTRRRTEGGVQCERAERRAQHAEASRDRAEASRAEREREREERSRSRGSPAVQAKKEAAAALTHQLHAVQQVCTIAFATSIGVSCPATVLCLVSRLAGCHIESRQSSTGAQLADAHTSTTGPLLAKAGLRAGACPHAQPGTKGLSTWLTDRLYWSRWRWR